MVANSMGINFTEQIHQVQRARQIWFQLGDKNNKYFQTMSTIRKCQNTISKIRDNRVTGLKTNKEFRRLSPKSFIGDFNQTRW